MNNNYQKFRGKCKEYCEEAILLDPTLTLVRGHYYCPIWNSDEPHWWCTRENGDIYDPTALQFPSGGVGFYTPFSGMVECANCGTIISESDALDHGNYGFCSLRCNMRFVGL